MRHKISHVKVGSTNIAGITAREIMDGMREVAELSDGNLDPSFVATQVANPTAVFSSLAIASALSAIGFGTAVGTFDAWALRTADDISIDSGSTHTRYEMANARIIPVSISASGSGNASFNAVAAGYAASGFPLKVTTSAARPTLPDLNTEVYVMGPQYINGTLIDGISQFDVAFGIGVDPDNTDASISAKDIVPMGRGPVISLTTMRPHRQNLMTLNSSKREGGIALSGTGYVGFFRKRSKTGYVADATEEHIKITALKGLVLVESSGGSPEATRFRVIPERDSNGFVDIDTTAAIAAPS